MPSLNSVNLIGYLGQDPEMKFTPNGTAVTSCSIATTQVYTKEGERKEETTWHNIVVFGKQAEFCNTYLHKGSLIFVEGRINNRSWEGNDGVKHFRSEVVASRVLALDKRKEDEQDVS